MVKKSEINKKGRLAKSTLSVVLAASMVLTSSSFVWAAPVEDIAIVEEGETEAVEAVRAPVEEAVVKSVDDASVEEQVGAALDNANLSVDYATEQGQLPSYFYDGTAKEPKLKIQYTNEGAGSTLVEGTDYTLSYENNTDAAESTAAEKAPTIKITYKGAYESLNQVASPANKAKTFTIEKVDISSDKGTLIIDKEDTLAFPYTGKTVIPAISKVVFVNGEGKQLPLSTDDYKVVEESTLDNDKDNDKDNDIDLINCGDKVVRIVAKDTSKNFEGVSSEKYKFTYTIGEVDASSDLLTLNSPKLVYSVGSRPATDLTEEITVRDKAQKKNLDPSEYTLKYRKFGDTAWSDTPIFAIGDYEYQVTMAEAAKNYVKESTITGTYSVIATESLDMYTPSITGFSLNDGVLEDEYDGTDKVPTANKTTKKYSDITLTKGRQTLTEGVDYSVSIPATEWKDAGDYSVVITGMGAFSGTMTIPVKITARNLNSNATTVAANIEAEASYGTTRSGNPSEIVVKVKDLDVDDSEVTLENGKDYTYTTSVDATKKKATVVITGKGNYTTDLGDSDTVKTLTITAVQADKLSLSDSSISAEPVGTISYSGTPFALETSNFKIVNTDGATSYTLTSSDFYVDKYMFNDEETPRITRAGEYVVTLTAYASNKYYSGSVDVTVNVSGKSFEDTFQLDTSAWKDLSYNGVDNVVAPSVIVRYKSNNAILPNNSKYNVKYYLDGKEVTTFNAIGTYTVEVTPNTGLSQYTGKLTATFNVIGKSIATATVEAIADQAYTGVAIEPAVKVSISENNVTSVLVKDKDYTVSYDKNTDVGTAYVTITGIGDYSGSIVKSFKIIGTDISKATVTVDGTYTYTGKAIVPTVTVKLGDKVIDAASYDVTATDNTNAGTAKVTVTGKGGCTGTTEAVEFTIGKADQKLAVSKATADALKIRNTNANTYTLKVTGAGTALSYTSSNTNVASVSSTGKLSFKHVCGKATITVTAVADDNHNAATLDVAVAVKPATPKITVTARAKGFNAKATTVKDITGYQVGYSTDKNFAASKTKKKLVKTTKALNKNFSGLSAKKGYYVRVRAYKKVGSTVYWGNWTSAKKITTK